jgi:hypothetical protein
MPVTWRVIAACVIAGASPLWVAPAALGAAVALLFFGTVASGQQHALQPLARLDHPAPPIDLVRVGIVALILVGTVATNVLLDFPAVGVWAAILVGWPLRRVDLRLQLRPTAAMRQPDEAGPVDL